MKVDFKMQLSEYILRAMPPIMIADEPVFHQIIKRVIFSLRSIDDGRYLCMSLVEGCMY